LIGVTSVEVIDCPQRPHAGDRAGSIGLTSVEMIDCPGKPQRPHTGDRVGWNV
jgi:hypothetical protein